MRRAAKVDDNHAEIVSAFRKFGCQVLSIAQLKNCADLVVKRGNKVVLVEVKDGTKPPSARKLTPGEVKFHAEWLGSVFVVKDLSDVIALVRAMELKQ